MAGDCPVHTRILATQAVRHAQRLWTGGNCHRQVSQGKAQGSRNTWKDEEFKKRLLSPIPAAERPLLGKWSGICMCSFVPGQTHRSLELGNLFLMIIWVTPHKNQMSVCGGQSSGLKKHDKHPLRARKLPATWLFLLLPLLAGKGLEVTVPVFGLLQPGAVPFGHSWFLNDLCHPNPQRGTFGNVQRFLIVMVEGREECYWHLVGGGVHDAAKHPTMHRQPPTITNSLAPNVSCIL